MTRRCALLALPLIASLLLCSCIDYVQSISWKDGKYHYYYKITLSKMLTELSGMDSDTDFASSVEDGDLPRGARIERIDSAVDVGNAFTFTIDPYSRRSDEYHFLPQYSGSTVRIPFLLGEAGLAQSFRENFQNDEMATGMTVALLASAKCRVLIAKEVVPVMDAAYFTDSVGTPLPVSFYDYGQVWALEIPFIQLLQEDTDFSAVTVAFH